MSDYRVCWIIQCFLVQSNMVTVPHNMVGLERMLDYRGVGLERFHCIYMSTCQTLSQYKIFQLYSGTIRLFLISSAKSLLDQKSSSKF